MKVQLDNITILFCGDSGDGIQFIGKIFCAHLAVLGHAVSGIPDYPAEIRAPAGSTNGVSSFTSIVSNKNAVANENLVDILVALNPAGYRKNISYLKHGGLLLINTDNFSPQKLEKLQIPLDIIDHCNKQYQVFAIPANQSIKKLFEGQDIEYSLQMRFRNIYFLGLTYWLLNLPVEHILQIIDNIAPPKQSSNHFNKVAFQAGYNYGDINELFCSIGLHSQTIAKETKVHFMSGNEYLAKSLVTAADSAGLPLFFASYPITPASSLLQSLEKLKNTNTVLVQAEDEIAAAGMALGAAYGGNIAITCGSGPGLDLIMEILGLAVMAEIPMLAIDIQRAGPSTGMPTKIEQTDLLAACFGRHGECPLPVFAISSVDDTEDIVILAVKMAFEFMTPVILLSDGFIANNIQNIHDKPQADANELGQLTNSRYRRWMPPGSNCKPQMLGGLETDHQKHYISYEPDNHQRNVNYRQAKINELARQNNMVFCHGKSCSKILILSWGSNYAVVRETYEQLAAEGHDIGFMHLKLVYPLPAMVLTSIRQAEKLFVVELNLGQLAMLIKNAIPCTPININKVSGSVFTVKEVRNQIVMELNHA